jgi:predicted nuclease of predicted toxin-antitoxin system
MNFKTDENLPIEIAELLINAGHDAKTINDQQLQSARDPILINVCKSCGIDLQLIDLFL